MVTLCRFESGSRYQEFLYLAVIIATETLLPRGEGPDRGMRVLIMTLTPLTPTPLPEGEGLQSLLSSHASKSKKHALVAQWIERSPPKG